MSSSSTIMRSALDEADRHDRWSRFALIGAALTEAALLGIALTLIDFGDRTQALIFVLGMLTYLTLALGLIAMAARFSAANARVLKALEMLDARPVNR